MFSTLRFRAHQTLLRSVQSGMRRVRMRACMERIRLRPGDRILDFGGRPEFWNLLEATPALDITMINLPGTTGRDVPTGHRIRFVEADACGDLAMLEGERFDVAFSNSVIEHVGDEHRQAAFARNVRRFAARYWVQTPARGFPIEAHTGMPFWWYYPEPLRRAIVGRWRRSFPAWSDDVAQTRVLTRCRLEALFPDGRIYVERFAGIPKSYSAFRAG